jgi:hypothetical protein
MEALPQAFPRASRPKRTWASRFFNGSEAILAMGLVHC